MKSVLELELELANAKLAKMTSTVKQLGTKLKKANEDNINLCCELSYYKDKAKDLESFRDSIRKTALTVDESRLNAESHAPFNKLF